MQAVRSSRDCTYSNLEMIQRFISCATQWSATEDKHSLRPKPRPCRLVSSPAQTSNLVGNGNGYSNGYIDGTLETMADSEDPAAVVYSMAEFILRDQTLSDDLATALIHALPFPSPSSSKPSSKPSPSFRRAILLRALSADLSSRGFSPRTLRVIELLHALSPNPMSSKPLAAEAYLSVATYVVTSAEDFAAAVKSVFVDRIGCVLRSPDAVGLVSDRTKTVAAEMERALEDPVLREELVRRSTLEETMEAVRVFVKKEREEMESQPCSFETAIREVAKRKTFTSKSIPSPEVKKVLDDLRSSCAELMGKVEDPLPGAIKFANEVAGNLRTKVGETGMEIDTDAPRNSGEGTSTEIPKKSFMDRQTTAFCYGWEETPELTPDGSEGTARRFRLPTPKKIPISPLRQVPDQKLGVRRKAKRWTVLEEDTLRKAVEELGRGNWKQMLNQYRFIFVERTEIDLKDKWRNMTR